MPLFLHAQPQLRYDLKLSVNEDMSLLSTVRIQAENVTADTLRFHFGNALISYWPPTISSNCKGFILDTIQAEKYLLVPTYGQSTIDFSINYCLIPFVSVVTRSKATLYDNIGFENFLPNLTEDYILEMGKTEVKCPDGFECIYPERSENIRIFIFWLIAAPIAVIEAAINMVEWLSIIDYSRILFRPRIGICCSIGSPRFVRLLRTDYGLIRS